MRVSSAPGPSPTTIPPLRFRGAARIAAGVISLDRIRQFKQFLLGGLGRRERAVSLEFHLGCMIAVPMASAWRFSPLGPLGIILTESEPNERDQSFRHSQQNCSLRPTPSLSTSIVVQMLLTLGFSTVMASTPCFPLSIPQLGPGPS